MHNSKPNRQSEPSSLCTFILYPLTLAFSFALPAGAQEQIAQAIPPAAPAGGIYSLPPAKRSGSGILGNAIDRAESSSQNSEDSSASGINLSKLDLNSTADEESRKIAQAAQGASENAQSLDLAPVKLPERGTPVFQANQFQTGLLYKLPARMYFLSSTENSLRYQSNALQTLHNNRSDMVYRILPNVTLGYAFTKSTRVAFNYFFLRDQYMRNNQNLSINLNSFAGQIYHDIAINEKTNMTVGFMGRQLLQSRGQPLSDLIPSVNVTRRVGNNSVLYGGLLGQIRFRNTLGKFQEADPFYTVGIMHRTPRWQFVWDNTLITAYGNRKLRFGPNNGQMIMTLEADYKVSPRLPLIAFVRAQPIFNIGANQAQGFAGFDFRLFGGLRIDISKAPVFPVKVARK